MDQMKIVAAASAIVALSLLLSAASATDTSIPIAANSIFAERIHRQFLDGGLGLGGGDEAGMIEKMTSDLGGSSSSTEDFSRACLEISRKAKEAVKDQSLADKIDRLATAVCHSVAPKPDVEAKLGSYETCEMCQGVLEAINNVLGDTESQILIIVYLLKTCENRTDADLCKKLAFSLSPIVISGIQSIVGGDVCYLLHVCSFPKLSKSQVGEDDGTYSGGRPIEQQHHMHVPADELISQKTEHSTVVP